MGEESSRTPGIPAGPKMLWEQSTGLAGRVPSAGGLMVVVAVLLEVISTAGPIEGSAQSSVVQGRDGGRFLHGFYWAERVAGR